MEEGWEGNGFVLMQCCILKRTQLQAEMARLKEDFTFRADCCDANMSRNVRDTMLPFPKSI